MKIIDHIVGIGLYIGFMWSFWTKDYQVSICAALMIIALELRCIRERLYK